MPLPEWALGGHTEGGLYLQFQLWTLTLALGEILDTTQSHHLSTAEAACPLALPPAANRDGSDTGITE